MENVTASELVPEKAAHKARRITIDDRPKLGEWYWIKVRTDEPEAWESHGRRVRKRYKKDQKPMFREALLCAVEIGSNYVAFSLPVDNHHSEYEAIHNRDIYERVLRPEPNWKDILNLRIAEKQKELQNAVKALADVCDHADLLPKDTQEPASLLPTTTRQDPKLIKRRLLRIQKHTYPKAKENVEQITKQLVALHEAIILPERSQFDRMKAGMQEIDNRLFALHLYAGFEEDIKQIAEGEPAEAATPVTVRQMLRFMDEETLFDYDKGGMDFKKLADFDKWVVKPENISRLAPEPRCVVGLRVRREDKDYGPVTNFASWFQIEENRKQNMKTYLLIRNGQNVYRIATEIDFSPRLLPFRAEFHQPLVKKAVWSGDKDRVITREDLEFDKHMEERKDEVRHYNRVIFLLQGLLDRSKVFAPHPPINLSDASQVGEFLLLKYDEEDGLPSANPPVWDEYRDRLNAAIKIGDSVWATYEKSEKPAWSRDYREVRHTGVYKVTQIKKDRSALRISWPWGTRQGYEHHYGRGRYYGKYGEWPVNKMRHQWVPMQDAFNVMAYTPGDYKKFLCDAYLKGAYLRWAPQLLRAEKWHMEKSKVRLHEDKAEIPED